MLSLNRVMISGNVVTEPTLNYTTNSTPVCNFRIANNYKVGPKEKTCFMDCSAFGKMAESVMQFCQKGSPVLVEGRLDEDQWTTEDGQKRFKHYITAHYVHFLRGKSSAPMADVDI